MFKLLALTQFKKKEKVNFVFSSPKNLLYTCLLSQPHDNEAAQPSERDEIRRPCVTMKQDLDSNESLASNLCNPRHTNDIST